MRLSKPGPVVVTLFAALLFLPSLRAQNPTPSAAVSLEKQGKLQEAAEAWRAITEQNPADASAFASLGLVLSREGKYAEAAFAYRKAILLKPDLPGVQLNLGLAEFKQGHFEAALPPLRAALDEDPHSMQATTLLGLSCYGARRFPEAVKYLAVAAASDPANTELDQTLAQSCLLAKNYSCALQQFGKLQQINPNSWAVHLFTGEAFDGEDRTGDAIVELQKAIQLAPRRQPQLNFALGYLYWKVQEYDKAATAFHAELAIVPGNAQALAYLGDIAMNQGRYEHSLALLRKAVQLQSDNRLAYLDIGAILEDQRKYREALAPLGRAVELDPAQPDAHFRLARVYQLLGNRPAAEKEFAEGRKLREKQDQDLASKMRNSRSLRNP
jgi:tetratricopeptide (TPR) repeat protein